MPGPRRLCGTSYARGYVLPSRWVPLRNDRPKEIPIFQVADNTEKAKNARMTLPDPATVVVVGGGPAGSFFSIRLLRRARELGRSVRVVILEKKTEVCFYNPAPFSGWEGCNYCAGGVSPRLNDILAENGIVLPPDVIEGEADEVIVHGDWKSIELPVPRDRRMVSVFRGSRPRSRADRYDNFDTFLLSRAVKEGAEAITAEVEGVAYSAEGRPAVAYRTPVTHDRDLPAESVEADFVVVAAGVNRSPGADPASDPLIGALRAMMPGLKPPKVRRTVIAEMLGEDGLMLPLSGEVHFVQYGSRSLQIEMASLIPKDTWMTVVLLGKTVDRTPAAACLPVMHEFVDLPHIRRLLPPKAKLQLGCCCHPNMTVGAARNPFGDRIALVGDMAVSRLYKDGLYSAYVTASALADCVAAEGIDRAALARCYYPVVKRLHLDNRYGRLLFGLSRTVFSHPALSRVLYRAVLTERMERMPSQRRLGDVLWRIASGDDSYSHILRAMVHPASVRLILAGGLVGTVLDRLAEIVFGLDWTGVGRYPIGVPAEEVGPKREQLFTMLDLEPPAGRPDVERMFSIRIHASHEAIMSELGAFGDYDPRFFKLRFVKALRIVGAPNEIGATIRYNVPLGLSFSLALTKVVDGRYLLYRILDGFGRGGVFAFDIEQSKPGVNLLTTYVGFDLPHDGGLLRRAFWALVRRFFPRVAHDAVWNHTLCKIRQLAEEAS
jgi:flavin-dependent dehydrogenase